MIRKLLLAALIAVPICYYFALIIGAATYPGYSHVTRYASELGAADAPYPALFNVPIIIGGVAAVLASIGVVAALRDLSGRCLWAVLAGVALACWGRIRSRSSRTPCAAVCVSRNSKITGCERNETFSWLYLCWLGDRAGDHVRRRAPGHAWQCWNLAANQYRHFHSVVRGAWCLAAQTRCQYSARASSRSCGSLTTLRLLLGRRVKIVMAVFASASFDGNRMVSRSGARRGERLYIVYL